MATKFKITICIEGGNLLVSTKDIWVDCDQVVPLGVQVIRQANSSECFVARNAYMFSFQGILYGTFSFNTLQEFVNYRNDNCVSTTGDDCCILTFNGCALTFKGVVITSSIKPSTECCSITHKGCFLTFNNKIITHGM